jgi:hypothetical protein
MNSSYIDFLKTEIFKTTEYHQFNLLFDALESFFLVPTKGVVILERSYIYGGRSLFKPLVPQNHSVSVIDYKPASAETRSNYQGSWIDKFDFEFPLAEHLINDLGTGYQFSFVRLEADTLLIPNVLHHCRDFPGLMANIQSSMPKLRTVLIFDSYLRENHQAPDDFCRYTPAAGFPNSNIKETGNVFDGILYLISQARWQLENAPNLADIKIAFDQLQPRLREIRNEEQFRSLGRPHAFMSTAYSMQFHR